LSFEEEIVNYPPTHPPKKKKRKKKSAHVIPEERSNEIGF
jgi:hypothetical protein